MAKASSFFDPDIHDDHDENVNLFNNKKEIGWDLVFSFVVCLIGSVVGLGVLAIVLSVFQDLLNYHVHLSFRIIAWVVGYIFGLKFFGKEWDGETIHKWTMLVGFLGVIALSVWLIIKLS
jgi:hypothetical protein